MHKVQSHSSLPKFLLPLVILILIFNVIQAQNEEGTVPMEDVVYLKNGWILRGTITEMIPEEKVTIRTWARNTFVFEMEEVLKVTKEKRPVRQVSRSNPAAARRRRRKKSVLFKDQGFEGVVSAGFLFGRNNWGGPTIRTSIQGMGGYRFFPQLTLGAAVSLDSYSFSNLNDFNFTTLNANILSFSLEARGDLLKESNVTPFYYANLGYGTDWLVNQSAFESFDGGICGGGGFGFRFYTATPLNWSFSLGFKGQNFSAAWTEFDPWGNPDPISVTQRGTMQRVYLRAGIGF